MLCRTNTVETGDGGNNDLICSPYVHLFICLVPVAAPPMYPLRRVVSTVAFEISCKFAWADETVYLMGTEGRASYVWARGVTDSLGLGGWVRVGQKEVTVMRDPGSL